MLEPKHPERAHGQAEKLLGDVGALKQVEHAAAAICADLNDGGLLQLLARALRD